MSKEDEEAFRRVTEELRKLEDAYNSFQGQMSLLDTVLSELQMANATLEGLKKEKPEVSLLVPIGGGVYVKAKLADIEQVVMSIGVGISKEKSIDEAIGSIGARISELQATKAKMEQQISLCVERINEKRGELEAIYEKIRGGKT